MCVDEYCKLNACRIRAWSLRITASCLEQETEFVQERNWELLRSLCSFTTLLPDTGIVHMILYVCYIFHVHQQRS